MRKTLTILSAFALIGLTAMAAIAWDSNENLAKGAAVTVSSNPGAANVITDGNDGSRWQANPGTHANTADWALIDLGEAKTFTDIEIIWEASHCRSFSIYATADAPAYTEEDGYNLISDEWLSANTPVATGTDDTEANYTSNSSFDAVSARYILIYANEYNNFGNTYGMSIFEVKVANIANRNVITALSVTPATAAVDAEVTVTVGALNAIGEPVALTGVTDLKLTASDPSVSIKGGENGVFTVSGTTSGRYTLTATAMANGAEVSGSAQFVVEYDWTGVQNAAKGKKIIGRFIPGLDFPYTLENAVDGDASTYYQYNGDWGGGDAWVMVDLGSEYYVDAIGATYATGGGRVKLGYALDDTDLQSYVSNNSQWMWNTDNVPAGWTFSSSLVRGHNSTVTVTYDEPVKARYIAVRDADNPNGKPQLCEVLVAGTKIQASVASDLEITFEKGGLFAGETTAVSVSVVDQYGEPMETGDDIEISVEGAAYADGVITATQKGKVAVTAKAGDAVKTSYIMVADQADYCMDGAAITSDESKSAASAAIDGGADPANHGNLYVVTENESPGEHTHWILADLHKEYDLDMIIAIWEGACPADYDVYVGATEDSLEKLYSIKGHTQNTWYDRFSGKEMKGVRYIKLVTTRNATGYGIKLFDLKAYGTSNMVSIPTEISISASGDNISTDEAVAISATVLDQFGGAMSELPIEFNCEPETATVENNQFRASEVGNYEVTATYGELSASTMINVVAHADNHIAAPASVTLNGETHVSNPFNNEEIVITGIPSTLEIEFDAVYNLNLIKLRWEAACPSHYTVVATYADGTTATILNVEGRGFQAAFNPIDRIIHVGGPAAVKSRVAVEDKASLAKVKKLTITPTDRDHGYNLRLFGVDAYGVKDDNTSANPTIGIDGVAEQTVYDLQGRRVANPTRGLYIIGGRKVLLK